MGLNETAPAGAVSVFGVATTLFTSPWRGEVASLSAAKAGERG